MKLTGFLASLVSGLLLASGALHSEACYYYPPSIPAFSFFGTSEPKSMADYDREENLRLWQSLTSNSIPLADINEAVYRWPTDSFSYWQKDTDGSNRFIRFIRENNDNEICMLLNLAKKIEERREAIASPWYYPRSRDYSEVSVDLDDLIELGKSYSGKRLRDRYALQITCALFASRRYADCIAYADSAFASYPDGNLMKCMARRYVAGS